jgi:hypothetical protein
MENTKRLLRGAVHPLPKGRGTQRGNHKLTIDLALWNIVSHAIGVEDVLRGVLELYIQLELSAALRSINAYADSWAIDIQERLENVSKAAKLRAFCTTTQSPDTYYSANKVENEVEVIIYHCHGEEYPTHLKNPIS